MYDNTDHCVAISLIVVALQEPARLLQHLFHVIALETTAAIK